MKLIIAILLLMTNENAQSSQIDQRAEDFTSRALIKGVLKHTSITPLTSISGDTIYFTKSIFRSKKRIYFVYSINETARINPIINSFLNMTPGHRYTIALNCLDRVKVVKKENGKKKYFIFLGDNPDYPRCLKYKIQDHGEVK